MIVGDVRCMRRIEDCLYYWDQRCEDNKYIYNCKALYYLLLKQMFLNAKNSCEGLSESRWMINIFLYSLKSGPPLKNIIVIIRNFFSQSKTIICPANSLLPYRDSMWGSRLWGRSNLIIIKAYIFCQNIERATQPSRSLFNNALQWTFISYS